MLLKEETWKLGPSCSQSQTQTQPAPLPMHIPGASARTASCSFREREHGGHSHWGDSRQHCRGAGDSSSSWLPAPSPKLAKLERTQLGLPRGDPGRATQLSPGKQAEPVPPTTLNSVRDPQPQPKGEGRTTSSHWEAKWRRKWGRAGSLQPTSQPEGYSSRASGCSRQDLKEAESVNPGMESREPHKELTGQSWSPQGPPTKSQKAPLS